MRLFGRPPLSEQSAVSSGVPSSVGQVRSRSRAEQRRADQGADARHQRFRSNNALPTLVAALDVGSQKTICMIARRERDRLRVIGIGHQQSHGVKNGVVVDTEAVERTILNAVHMAEQAAGQSISSVSLCLSAGRPSSRLITTDLSMSGGRVRTSHVRHLTKQASALASQAEQAATPGLSRQLLSCDPVDFSVDFERSIKDPRGLFADKLSGTFHALSVQTGTLKTLQTCVERNLLTIDQLLFAPLCASQATLSDEERQLGALLIDIGAGTTSFALTHAGAVVYTGTIPIGGEHITNDLSQAYAISRDAAERIKIMDGAAISFSQGAGGFGAAENDINVDQRITTKAELVGYIRPRCEELFEMLREQLEQSGCARFQPRRAVLVGGGACLLGMDRLASEVLSLSVRQGSNQGSARALLGLPERYQSAPFAAVLGTLSASATISTPAGGGLADTGASLPLAAQGSPATGSKIGQWFRAYF